MRALVLAPVFVAAVLLAIAGVVFGLGDTRTLVSPPEAVVEGFLRQLAAGRYDRALPFLDDTLAWKAGREGMRQAARRLESRGEVSDVRGEPGWQDDRVAEASAKVKRAGETFVLRARLSRSHGLWKVAQVPDLGL